MSLPAVLVAALVAWGPAFAPDGERLYSLHLPVDGELDNVAAQAVAAWEVKLPGELKVALIHEPCPEHGLSFTPEGARVRHICLESLDSAQMEAIENNPNEVGVTWRDDEHNEQIRIDTEYLAGTEEIEVLAHELGHAMGIHHLKWYGSLMYPSTRRVADPTPWRVDLQAWHRVRR